MWHSDVIKMCLDFASNFGNNRTSCCIRTAHRLTLLSSSGNFWQK
jgi:hypothetical protein